MGIGITVTCKSCSYNKSFLLGIGMDYPYLLGVVKELNKKARLQVEELIVDNKIESYKYSRALYRCPKCGTLAEKGSLTLFCNEGSVFQAPYFCRKCKSKFEIVDNLETIRNIECPKCKSVSLDYIENILWD